MPHAFDTLPAGGGSNTVFKQLRSSLYAWAVIVIVVLVCAVAGVAISREYAQYQERAAVSAHNTAALINVTVKSLASRIDTTLQLSARYYEHLLEHPSGRAVDIDHFLADQRRAQPDILNLRITDAAGNMVHGLAPSEGASVNLAERPFFITARDHRDSGLIVSGPVFAKIAQQWVLVLARRLEDPRHRFIGVIYANVAVDTFAATLSVADLGPHGAATLRMDNMALIYRSPKPTDGIGSTKVSPQMAQIAASGLTQGLFHATTALDGINRINAFRRVDGLPLYVIVGLAPQDQANSLALTTGLILVLTTAVLVAVSGCTYLIWKAATRLRQDHELRLRLESRLRTTQSALSKAQEVARVGNWVWDFQTGQAQWSKELFDIFGMDSSANIPTLDDMRAQFDANSWQRLRNAIDLCATEGISYDLDCLLPGTQGPLKWINAKGQAERDRDGRIERLFGTVQDITGRKVLEIQLEQANDELDDLYNHVPCAYYSLDAQGLYVKINDTMLSWIGYTRADAIEKLTLRQSLSPESSTKFDALFPQYKATGQIKNEEFELLDREGRKRIVSASASAVFDSDGRFQRSRSVMFDVTELRRAQERIAQIMAEQDGILHNQMVGALKVIDRRITWLNPALCQLFGYAADELMGHSTRVLYRDSASFEQIGADAYPRLAAGETFRMQLQMQRKDGQLLWIDVQGVLIDPVAGESLWMFADVTALRQSQESFEYDALHDALTGLANRAFWDGQIGRHLAQAQRLEKYAAVCYVDLDGFKPINDQYGHASGDVVLKHVARRLSESVRAIDTVARIGGDEFVLLLANLDSPEDCEPILQRARQLIEQPIEVDGTPLSVSMSVGVAVYPLDSTEPERLLALADQRMYAEKNRRKGR